jgi:hypothetical protein
MRDGRAAWSGRPCARPVAVHVIIRPCEALAVGRSHVRVLPQLILRARECTRYALMIFRGRRHMAHFSQPQCCYIIFASCSFDLLEDGTADKLPTSFHTSPSGHDEDHITELSLLSPLTACPDFCSCLYPF